MTSELDKNNISAGDNFELYGSIYRCIKIADHYWYCFAIPINEFGAPKWFPRDDMGKAKKI